MLETYMARYQCIAPYCNPTSFRLADMRYDITNNIVYSPMTLEIGGSDGATTWSAWV